MLRGPSPAKTARLLALLATLAAAGCERVTLVVIDVASVSVVPDQIVLVEGESTDAQAVVRGPGGEVLTGRTLFWSSQAPGIAQVSQGGKVTAVAPGETFIRVTVEDRQSSVGIGAVQVLAGPELLLTPSLVELDAPAGGTSPTEAVSVQNGGNGVLSGLGTSTEYGEGEPQGWLDVGLSGTTAPATLSVGGVAAGLAPGQYTARVTVSSPVAGGLSAELDVVFTVSVAAPVIVLETDQVVFAAVENGQQAARQTVSVTNGGGGVLSGLDVTLGYGHGQPTGWLEATLDATTAPTTLRLAASPQGLLPSTYTAFVYLGADDAANSPVTLSVVFTVSPAGTSESRHPAPATVPPTR